MIFEKSGKGENNEQKQHFVSSSSYIYHKFISHLFLEVIKKYGIHRIH